MSTNKLIKIFKEEFEISESVEIDYQTNFKDVVNWSSMNALVVIILIENEYNVIVEDEDLKQLKTFKELFDLIISKRKKGE